MTRLNELLDSFSFATGKELFDAFRGTPDKRDKRIPTLGEFLEIIAAEERDKEIGASSNYQLYFTLHNKLKGVNLNKDAHLRRRIRRSALHDVDGHLPESPRTLWPLQQGQGVNPLQPGSPEQHMAHPGTVLQNHREAPLISGTPGNSAKAITTDPSR